MELQDLQDRWAVYDRKLEASLRLNTTLLRRTGLNQVESSLQPLSRSIVFELLGSLGVVVLLGMFLADHFTEVRFLAPAVALDLFALYLVIASVRQLVALDRMDYSAPIVALQKQLEQLRIDRIRTTKWTLVLSPLLWTPLLIVSLEGVFGLDAYRLLDGTWLAANLLFGVVFLAVMVWAARRLGDRFKGSPFVQRLLDDVAGRSLSAAAGFLKARAQFEEEH